MHVLDSKIPNWKFCFVSEFDAVDHNARVPDVFSSRNVRVHRHHPGFVSRSMAWLVKHDALPCVHEVSWLSRTGALILNTSPGHRQRPVLIGVHGSHCDSEDAFC